MNIIEIADRHQISLNKDELHKILLTQMKTKEEAKMLKKERTMQVIRNIIFKSHLIFLP